MEHTDMVNFTRAKDAAASVALARLNSDGAGRRPEPPRIEQTPSLVPGQPSEPNALPEAASTEAADAFAD